MQRASVEYIQGVRQRIREEEQQYTRDYNNALKREKVTCECGLVGSRGNMAKHERTKIHKKRMKMLAAINNKQNGTPVSKS